MCVGILDGSQQHVLVPPSIRLRQYRARTGTNTRVFLLFGNCGAPPTDGSRFSVESVSYEISR